MAGTVVQVSVSKGGVPKLPVLEALVSATGVAGDGHNNRKLHGGPEQAVCLFAMEIIEALQGEGHPIFPGATGENITVRGFDWALVQPGVRLRVGAAELEVTKFTSPCKTNEGWFKEGDFGRISEKTHPGWSRVYARVLREGVVRPGDVVVLVDDSRERG